MLCAIIILLFQIIIQLAFLTICIVGGSNDYEERDGYIKIYNKVL